MVVEHSFVVVGDGQEAMERGRGLLRQLGFSASEGQAFGVGTEYWRSVDMRRGKAKPEKAKSLVELPQVVVLEFDRNLVTMGASIVPNRAWGGKRGLGATVGQDGDEKRMRRHIALMVGLATALERRMARGEELESVLTEVRAVEAEALKAARSRKIRTWIIAGVLLVLILGLLLLPLLALWVK